MRGREASRRRQRQTIQHCGLAPPPPPPAPTGSVTARFTICRRHGVCQTQVRVSVRVLRFVWPGCGWGLCVCGQAARLCGGRADRPPRVSRQVWHDAESVVARIEVSAGTSENDEDVLERYLVYDNLYPATSVCCPESTGQRFHDVAVDGYWRLTGPATPHVPAVCAAPGASIGLAGHHRGRGPGMY